MVFEEIPKLPSGSRRGVVIFTITGRRIYNSENKVQGVGHSRPRCMMHDSHGR